MKLASRRWIACIGAGLSLVFGLATPATADTGRLVVHLEAVQTPAFPPTLSLIGMDRAEAAVVGAIAFAAGEVRFDDLEPGIYRLGLEGTAGSAASVEIGIPAGGTAAAAYDVDRATLRVLPYEPDPFGLADGLDAAWIAALPGEGTETASGLFTSPSAPRPTVLDGVDVTGKGFRRPVAVRGGSMVRSYRAPIGVVSAARDRASFEILSSGDARYSDIEAATGSLGRHSFEGSAARSFGDISWKPRAFLALRGMNYLDATGSIFENDRLPHNGLDELELLARADARPGARTKLGLLAYGEGTRRHYFLEPYRYNPSHSPRQDRANFQGAMRLQHRPSSGSLLLAEMGWQRTYVATGDGRYFDDLRKYGRPSDVNDATVDGMGLYWQGDDPASLADEGHVYNYFRKNLEVDVTGRLEVWKDPGTPRAFGAGIHARRGTYRSYEHHNPIRTLFDVGYTNAQAIGYGIDGTEHDDSSERSPGTPLSLAAFATTRRPIGGGEMEAGLRASIFRSGQRPLRDLKVPRFVDPERLNLDDEKTHATIDPRLGFTRSLASRIRIWTAAGIETRVPPSEALYYSEDYLLRVAETDDPAFRNTILGNPGLASERDWSVAAALGIDLGRSLLLRVGAEGKRTTDAITAGSVPVEDDSLTYYMNDGDRDRIGLFARADWEPSRWLALRASYDLSRTRTETSDPVLLDGAWLDHDLPLRGADMTEGLPLLFPINDDGIGRDAYPSLYDRRHLASVATRIRVPVDLLGEGGRILLEDLEIGALFTFASGRPFTWVQSYPFGELLTDESLHETEGDERNSGRLPEVYQLNLRLTRKVDLFGADLLAWAEVLNALDRENPIRVYHTTGDAEDDGWRDPDAAYDLAAYLERLRDLHNYSEPRLFRVGLRLGTRM